MQKSIISPLFSFSHPANFIISHLHSQFNIRNYIYLMAKTAAKKSNLTAQTSFWLDDKKVGWLLAGIAFVLYAQTISFGFALDDIAVVHGNDFVKAGFGGIGKILNSFYWQGFPSFSTANSGIFRPVSLILFAIEWQFAPNSPKFFHFVQVVLYAVSIYQLYRLLRMLFREYSISLSLIAAGIWLVMPIHTEVVANIKSADEVLCMIFFLLSFRHLLNWADYGKMNSLVFSAIFIFLSLLSKEGGVLFIPAMLLALLMFRKKQIKELVLPAAILGVVSLIWFGWHTAVISGGPERVTYDYRNNALLSNDSYIDQLGTAIGLQARYWMKLLFGYPLSYNYSFNEIPVDGFAGIWCWISLAGIGASLFFAWKFFKSIPVLSFAILFYFISFALTSNIFYRIGDIFAERFTFAPSIGFAILLSWLILKFTKGVEEKRIHAQAMYALIGIGFVYSVLTFSRSSDWKDEASLYAADLDHAPNSARVHYNYGVVLLGNANNEKDETQKNKIIAQSNEQFKIATEIDSIDFQSAQALGNNYYNLHEYNKAIYWYNKSIAGKRVVAKASLKNPNSGIKDVKDADDPNTFSNLGDVLMLSGKYDSAFVVFERAAGILKNNDAISIKIGGAYLAQHDTANAIVFLKKATEANPKSVLAWDKLANLYGMKGEFENSTDAFNHVLENDPKNLHALQMISTNYLMRGDTAKAIEFNNKFRAAGGK